jgi:hypothetical protein
MRIKGSKNKNKGKVLTKSGYLEVFEPKHPLAKKNGYVLEHRMIAFDLGMLTNLTNEVHHKNGIKSDNKADNLEVLPKTKHTSITWKGKKRGAWTDERKIAKSLQMKGNQNWRGNIYDHPALLRKDEE